MTTRTLRVKVSDENAEAYADALLKIDEALIPQAVCIQVLVADRLRLAQALRLLRDTTSGSYIQNVCVNALDECGIADPPEEDHL